jgi:ASC-1-like (ASCH) protein
MYKKIEGRVYVQAKRNIENKDFIKIKDFVDSVGRELSIYSIPQKMLWTNTLEQKQEKLLT